MNSDRNDLELRIAYWLQKKYNSISSGAYTVMKWYAYISVLIWIIIFIISFVRENSDLLFYLTLLVGMPWIVLLVVPTLLMVFPLPYYECFKYLRKRDIPLGAARMIALLLNIGVVALVALFLNW